MTDSAKMLLVLGGTSDIGRATALVFAGHGWAIRLAGRDAAALQREAENIAVRSGVPVEVDRFDVLDTASFAAFIGGLPVLPDTVLSVIGILGDQTRAQTDAENAALIMRSNYEGPALILGLFAERFAARGSGTLVGVSSVAGDRGRGSNYVYGSAKAGFTAFLSGLRNRMAKHGVAVITVKPGFVRSKMTDGLALPGLLTVDPAAVGAAILNAETRHADVIYVSRIWWLVMTMIQLLPEFIFKRLSL